MNVIIIFLVLGFIPSVFIGIERGWTYSVQAGFLSGKPPQGGTLFLDLVLGTAGELIILSSCSRSYFFCYLLGMKDVSASPQVRPHATEPILTFQIELTLDGISQEFNETFSIYIIGVDLDNYFLFPVEAPVTVNCLEGTIIDQDSKSSLLLALLTMSIEFSLTNDDFRQNEANALMEIHIAKDGVLANPVRFRLKPMTVLEAERLGVFNFTRPADDSVSPSIAGKVQHVSPTSFHNFFGTDKNDFNATALNVTFPADEAMNIADVLETIPIVDDKINESHEQVFVIALEVLEAVNSDLITITRSNSLGRIIDNDGEPLSGLT